MFFNDAVGVLRLVTSFVICIVSLGLDKFNDFKCIRILEGKDPLLTQMTTTGTHSSHESEASDGSSVRTKDITYGSDADSDGTGDTNNVTSNNFVYQKNGS